MRALVLLWIVAAGVALLYGVDYYRLPLAERPFAPEHALLSPSGTIGHLLGIVGTAMMLFGVAMYGVRKRVHALARFGRLRTWLQVHIFLCTLGPFLVLLHTSFKVGGLVSIAFWSMTIVVLSGVFGRYVYVRVPRTLQGQAQSLRALEAARAEQLARIERTAGIAAADIEALAGLQRTGDGLLHALWAALAFDATRRRRTRAIRSLLERRGVARATREPVLRSIEEEMRLAQQTMLLQPFQRLFHYWHVFHLPLAIVMFVILAVHVAVAALFGYGLPF